MWGLGFKVLGSGVAPQKPNYSVLLHTIMLPIVDPGA